MSERISIEKQNEIMITWLLVHAGYDFGRDKKKAVDEEEKVEMNPLACLKMVNARIDREAMA